MSIIKIKCVDQTLTITNKPLIASGGQQENKMTFEFCSMWDGFTNTAVFYRNENEVYNVLIVDNECLIPNEMLQEEGKFYFGVFGVNGTARRTSEILSYQVTKGAYILGQAPIEPTPNIYEQMLNLHNQILTKYNQIFNEVDRIVAEAVLQGVVNQNDTNELVQFWFGTKAEYDALPSINHKWVYVINDDEPVVKKAEEVTERINGITMDQIFEGNTAVVKLATKAATAESINNVAYRSGTIETESKTIGVDLSAGKYIVEFYTISAGTYYGIMNFLLSVRDGLATSYSGVSMSTLQDKMLYLTYSRSQKLLNIKDATTQQIYEFTPTLYYEIYKII